MKDNEKQKKLKDYFKKRDDVLMAFVFGSRSKGYASERSDWDIAVYFKPLHGLEWEHDREYPAQKKVWADCVDILQTDNVDLVVLNRAPSTVADSAISGIPLVIKDRRLWIEFMLRITQQAEDFRDTVQEYADIYWRSTSLTKQDAEALNKRLVFMTTELRVLSGYTGLTIVEYKENDIKRRVVERTTENLMNATIDISKIILASSKKPIPSTYKEIVRLISSTHYFSVETADKLSSWTELRNILAHEYLDITWRQIHDFLKNSEPYFKQFIESAKKLLKKNVKNHPS